MAIALHPLPVAAGVGVHAPPRAEDAADAAVDAERPGGAHRHRQGRGLGGVVARGPQRPRRGDPAGGPRLDDRVEAAQAPGAVDRLDEGQRGGVDVDGRASARARGVVGGGPLAERWDHCPGRGEHTPRAGGREQVEARALGVGLAQAVQRAGQPGRQQGVGRGRARGRRGHAALVEGGDGDPRRLAAELERVVEHQEPGRHSQAGGPAGRRGGGASPGWALGGVADLVGQLGAVAGGRGEARAGGGPGEPRPPRWSRGPGSPARAAGRCRGAGLDGGGSSQLPPLEGPGPLRMATGPARPAAEGDEDPRAGALQLGDGDAQAEHPPELPHEFPPELPPDHPPE